MRRPVRRVEHRGGPRGVRAICRLRYDLTAVAAEPTLREYQAQVDAWITTYGVRYFSELNILAQLVEEVGEVARIVGRRYGEQSGDDPGRSLGDELADVLFT